MLFRSIEVDHISKQYEGGKVVALQQLSLSVEKGTIFGLIGPDGAGKTSLFRILTTLLLPDSGNAFVCGLNIIKDYKAIRNLVGYMPGKFSLYQDLSVEENLKFFASVFGIQISIVLISPVDFWGTAVKKPPNFIVKHGVVLFLEGRTLCPCGTGRRCEP